MPRRIGVPQRIPEYIRVPIQRLRIPRLRHDRVRLDEPPQRRVIAPRAVIIEPQPDLAALTRELPVGGQLAVAPARLAVGVNVIKIRELAQT